LVNIKLKLATKLKDDGSALLPNVKEKYTIGFEENISLCSNIAVSNRHFNEDVFLCVLRALFIHQYKQ
jgi:hypothetical protein